MMFAYVTCHENMTIVAAKKAFSLEFPAAVVPIKIKNGQVLTLRWAMGNVIDRLMSPMA